MKYDWVHDIDLRGISGEFLELVELIGVENTLKLYERFGKQQLYFSEKPLTQLKRLYILKHRHLAPKELARRLNLSEREIYYILQEHGINDRQHELFE